MVLCQTCSSLLTPDALGSTSPQLMPQHSSMTNFLRSVQEKCSLCWRAYRHLRPHMKLRLEQLAAQETSQFPWEATRFDNDRQEGMSIGGSLELRAKSEDHKISHVTRIEWELARSRQSGLQHLSISLVIDGIHDQAPAYCDALFLIPTADLGVFPQRSSLPDSTGSKSSLNTIRDWMENCVCHHSKCNTEELRTSRRPTRLIDIGKDTAKFFVVAGSEVAPDQTYIALSHRWGVKGMSNVLLKTENERKLSLGVPITSLSQTFQDAIVVARHFDIRFMWIDCLCIIQEGDDGLDWEANARQMGDVYQNAYFVLSADDSTGIEGLFFDRDPEFFSSVTLQTRDDDSMSLIDWTSVDRDMWFTEVNNSPLNSRGWVFQERMLAPRVIHFCRQEIFWECREKFCCESFPVTLPSSEVFNLGDAVPLRQLPVELWESSGWHGDEKFPVEDVPYEAWDDVVKAYTKAQFSYPEDKLVAISGVAKYTKTVIKDTYLAGLWRKRLAAEMAWWLYPHRDRYVLGAEPPYYAPSFSWASVKGRINSSGPFAIGILVEVECVTVASGPQNCNQTDEIFNDDVFGTALRSPSFQLKVTGKLRSARLAKREGRGWRLDVPVFPAANDSTHPRRPERLSSGDIGLPTCVDLEPWLDFTIADSDCDKIQSETFYLIDWRHGPQPGDYDMSEAELHCMILRQIDRERRQFQRMGWTRVFRDELKIDRLLSDNTKEILPACYNEDKGTHTIYLL